MTPFILCALLAVLGTSSAGKVDDWRVLRGQEAKAGELPYVAHFDDGGCTASILNPTTILTAGHCVCQQQPRAIVVGATRIGGSNQVYRVAQTIIHPSYRGMCPQPGAPDVAILKLASPIAYNANVRNIDLDCNQIRAGQVLWVMGYGKDEYGRSGVLKYAQSGISEVDRSGLLISRSTQFPSHILPGDSGGPVALQVGNSVYQVAINSGGGYSNTGHTALYAPVAPACQFIRQYM